MKYLSEDGKVFSTEKEYCEHEKGLEGARKEWKQV